MQFPIQQKFQAVVTNTAYLNKKVIKIDFKNTSSNKFTFLAGQFISLQVSHTSFRSYSLYGESLDSQEFSIIAAVSHEGVGSTYLKSLSVGQSINFIGPSGRFVLPEITPQKIVFIATGTGISPILTMINHIVNTKAQVDIKLFFGIRDESELFLTQKIESYKATIPNFEYTYCFSQSKPEGLSNSINGRVTNMIKDNIQSDTDYIICGHPEMVRESIEILLQNNISAEKIHREKFTIAKKPVA